MGGVGMFQLHKITAVVLTALFLISGIFAPYGSSYPFFLSANYYMMNTDLSEKIDNANDLDKTNLNDIKISNAKKFDKSKEFNKPKNLDESKEFNKTKDFNNLKKIKPKFQNNEICFENDLSQKKLLDFGTSLLLCSAVFIIINLHCKLRINLKLLGIPSLSLDLITYIHKMDGKKDKLMIQQS
jgi:hypothetical protein